MCGIVGCISKGKYGFNYKNIKAFESLLFLDTLRGDDSTGVFAVDNLGNVGIAKEAVTGEVFLKSKEWDKFSSELFKSGWAVVGHNRKATRGKVSDENAHPFWVEDKLVLVHNGSFFGSHNHIKNVEVDSNAIAHLLAEKGNDNIEEALQKVNAAYALVWYDVENKKLNVIRNNHRPLHFVEADDAWYFASELGMLDFVMSRENIKLEDKIYEFPEYNLNTWTLKDDKSSEIDSIDLDAQYKAPRPAASNDEERSYHHHMHGFGNPQHHRPHSYPSTHTPPRLAPPDRVVSPPPSVKRQEEKSKAPIMPWFPRVTLGVAKDYFPIYKSDTKIQVIVDDYTKTGENDKYVNVTGKTMDANKLPVTFPLLEDVIQAITNPRDQVENAIFEITVAHPSWTRADLREHKNIDDAEGVFMIVGKNPQLRFDGSGHGIQ